MYQPYQSVSTLNEKKKVMSTVNIILVLLIVLSISLPHIYLLCRPFPLKEIDWNCDKRICFVIYSNIRSYLSCTSHAGLYWRIHSIELLSALVFFVGITGLSTYLMAMAYRNTKFALKHKVAMKRTYNIDSIGIDK